MIISNRLERVGQYKKAVAFIANARQSLQPEWTDKDGTSVG